MTVQIDLGFVLIASKQFGLKMDVADMIYTFITPLIMRRLATILLPQRHLLEHLPSSHFCFVFKQACACRVPVYTSLCLVISHSVFVLMSSVITSPLVGLLIYIFTYLHSLLVAACLSPSASGETASGRTSGYVVFRSISPSPEVRACLISAQTLISRPSP